MTGQRGRFRFEVPHALRPEAMRRRLLGDVLWRPWFDGVASRTLTDVYFPLSRAWAAALSADGSVPAFCRELDLNWQPPLLGAALTRLARDRDALANADRAWERAMFDGIGDAAGAERARRRAAIRLMAGRLQFLPLLGRLPRMASAISDPLDVEARHADRLANPARAFSQPASPPPTVRGAAIVRDAVRTYCARFPSPVEPGGTAWARVSERVDATDAPTLVVLHGIGLEQEFWPEAPDAFDALLSQGVRLIRPELPAHGRRRPDGFFGGEAILAGAPLGTLDFFHAAVVEAGIWVAWARTLGTRVGLGGVSLGALTSQMAATAATAWPEANRPDALLLLTPGGDFMAIAFEGELTQAVGLGATLARHGWSRAALARWQPLLEPQGVPAVAPDRIVAALGDADRITPYGSAAELLDQWGVPPANVFTEANRGHFTTFFNLALDPRPLDRFRSLLGSVGPA
jgi:pimeloyl-ACP methyl ester carboxylesterase